MTTLEPQRISQPSPSPTVKVTAGSTAGAVSVVLVYAIGLIHQVPAEVGSAVTVLVTFLVSYLVRDRGVSKD